MFKKIVESAFNEWKKEGKCSEAENLNKSIGVDYFDECNPHFFTGDLAAKLVLISLNPKRDKPDWATKCSFDNFESYWKFYSEFGKENYGPTSKREHKSPFDHKLIRFLKPLNVLPFKKDDKFHNLEVVIDNKLQVELVPFGSPNFSYSKIGVENLEQFVSRILNIVQSANRDYVIFCGRIFTKILSPYITEQRIHRFKLLKKDGNETKHYFELINVKLKFGNVFIEAAIAPQFAKQGYPESRYGEKIAKLYGQF